MSTTTVSRTVPAELVEGKRLVEEVALAGDDADLAGIVTMTISLRDVPGGSEVEIRMAGMPDAVPPEQNEEGTRMALDALTRLVG